MNNADLVGKKKKKTGAIWCKKEAEFEEKDSLQISNPV